MNALSPLDCFIDPEYGYLTKCSFHTHIRECFLLEMHRILAKDQIRFQHSLQVLREDVLGPRLRIPTEYAVDVPPSLHDPRFRFVVERFMAMRNSVPMTLDEADLPVVCPPPGQLTALDIIETLRLAMNERDRVHLVAVRSRRRAVNARILIMTSLDYVRALRNMFDMTEGPQRAVFDYGIMSAMETERRIVFEAANVIDTYLVDREAANERLSTVLKRMATYIDLLDANMGLLHCDLLTSVAVAAHLHLFRTSVVAAGRQASTPLESFSVARVPPPTAAERAAWVFDAVKSDAVRKFILAERALENYKADMASIGQPVSIDFHIFPQRNHSTGVVTFYMEPSAYAEIQQDLISQ